jgi:hypothetical protein
MNEDMFFIFGGNFISIFSILFIGTAYQIIEQKEWKKR